RRKAPQTADDPPAAGAIGPGAGDGPDLLWPADPAPRPSASGRGSRRSSAGADGAVLPARPEPVAGGGGILPGRTPPSARRWPGRPPSTGSSPGSVPRREETTGADQAHLHRSEPHPILFHRPTAPPVPCPAG